MSAKLVFFIDVDNTLLDNDHIKEEIKVSLIKVFGKADADHFWAHYDGFRDYQKYIDFPKIVRGYCRELHSDKCKMEFIQVFNSIEFKHTLYPQVGEVLIYLRSMGPVYLFTEGDMVYQKRKVEASGLAGMVNRVFLFEHKMEHIDKVLNKFTNDSIVFIDDRADYLDRIKSLHPEIFTINIAQGHYAKIDTSQYKTVDLKFNTASGLLDLKSDQITMNKFLLSQ